jgi:hypothetical protein
MINFAIATFCYGERYYAQANRLISSFDNISIKPNIFIITDNIEVIQKRHFVFCDNISIYNSKYAKYATNYYDFDFSVKRFSLLHALNHGFTKIILVDADVVPTSAFNIDNINKCFSTNSISGPSNYILENEIGNNSMLGRRMMYYAKKFNIHIDIKNILVSEDCIQYFDIDIDKFYKFISTWDECIRIKDMDKLYNIPAGNIDEITFSALYNNIKLINNSKQAINLLNAYHDKWY